MRTALLAALLNLQASEVSKLVEQLGAGSRQERDAAEKKLADLGEPALPELDPATKHPDPEVSGRVRQVIRSISIQALAGRRIFPAPGSPHAWTTFFLEAREIPPQELEFPAMMATLGADAEEFVQVKEKAAGLNLLAARPEITGLLRGGDVDEAVLLSMVRLDHRDPAPKYADLLRSPLAEVRYPAALILAALRGARTERWQLELARDRDGRVRRIAARTLGVHSSKESLAALKELLKDGTFFVCAAAIESLAERRATEAVPDIQRFLTDRSAGVRSVAAAALGTLGAKECAPELILALGDESVAVRKSALQALGRLDARQAAPAISKLLDDPNEGVRAQAAALLTRFKP